MSARGPEGYVTKLLVTDDRVERFSLSHQNNLSSKEEILLDFGYVENQKDLGFIINFRQTLMTTYFIYEAMGYMGDEVSDVFAQLEKNRETRDLLKGGIKTELGNLDVYQWNDFEHRWDFISSFYETGPIAINRQMLSLKNISSNNKVKLKLVLNKGLWRIDYAALVNIKRMVEPMTLFPMVVINKGKVDPSALLAINNPEKHLISMPGGDYKLVFKLPNRQQDYELFLSSKGYYLEWMRASWIKEKNMGKLRQMVYQPKKFLRDEAKNFKEYEATMEHLFWNSKIDTKNFSYHEN